MQFRVSFKVSFRVPRSRNLESKFWIALIRCPHLVESTRCLSIGLISSAYTETVCHLHHPPNTPNTACQLIHCERSSEASLSFEPTVISCIQISFFCLKLMRVKVFLIKFQIKKMNLASALPIPDRCSWLEPSFSYPACR